MTQFRIRWFNILGINIKALAVVVALVVCVNAQTSKLKGTIYDATGAVVVKAKVTAVNSDGKKFETFSNDRGEYELVLPVNRPIGAFKEAKYDIFTEFVGFRKSEIIGYVFIPSQFGSMQLDIGLEIGAISDPSVAKNANVLTFVHDCEDLR